MATSNTTHLAGSVRHPVAGASIVREADRDSVIGITVYGASNLRTKGLPDPAEFSRVHPSQRSYLSTEDVRKLMAADPNDLDEIRGFLQGHGLSVSPRTQCARSLAVNGPIGKFEEAFGTKLSIWKHPLGAYRGRSGPLTVPKHLANKIRGAFGLDNRRIGYSYLRQGLMRQAGQSVAAPISYTAKQVATNYSYPSGADGTGQTVAVLAFNGALGETGETATGGYDLSVFSKYITSTLGLPAPKVSNVVVQGPGNDPDPSNPNDISVEVMLDLTMVCGTAPGANVVVYFSEFTEEGWVNVYNRIVQDAEPTIATCSYGNPETTLGSDPQSAWSSAAITGVEVSFQMAALKGLTMLCAAGDNGSSDGETGKLAHVDYPASSAWVTGCGGTRLRVSGTTLTESVWNDGPGSASGGGVSELFPLPTYQDASKVPPSVNPGHTIGRGVPDVSGVGDPTTGIDVPQLNGTVQPVGGTSAVAPMWAGLIARINQAAGKPCGYLNPFLYANCATGVLNDVTTGNNGKYAAGPGWDACSGIGTPNGANLLAKYK